MVASLAATVAIAGTAAPAAGAQEPLPVPWDLASFVAGGTSPDAVAGANDFSCRPSASLPRPVVLVHGLMANMGDNWATMAPLLRNNGFCVFALTYGRQPGQPYFGGLRPMESSAQELDAFVDRVLEATGAQQVDLVGHSEGTVMPRWWLRFLGGAPKVKRYVQLTPLWDGTNLAGIGELLALGKGVSPTVEPGIEHLFTALGCGSCPQFARGSRYLDTVNAAPGPAEPGIEYTGIVTKYDELVTPYTSGLLDAPNVKNVVLQDVCARDYAEHAAVAFDPVAAQIVLNALAPERARPVPCTLVLPTGAPDPPDVGLAPAPASEAVTGAQTRRCRTGRALRVTVPRRRGERVTRVVVTSGTRRVAVRRGRALRTVRVAGLRPGRRALRLRITSQRGTRTVTVRRTVRCA